MICEYIKAETKDFHTEAEKAMGAVRIFENDYKKDEYIRLLTALFYAHYSIEISLKSHNNKSFQIDELYHDKHELLEMDLKKMGVDIDKTLVKTFEIDSLAKAIGALYVLKGSEMGTSVISKHLQKSFQDIDKVSTEFYTLETNIFSIWRDFCQKLDILVLEMSENKSLDTIKSEVLEGAKNTYMQFINCSRI